MTDAATWTVRDFRVPDGWWARRRWKRDRRRLEYLLFREHNQAWHSVKDENEVLGVWE